MNYGDKRHSISLHQHHAFCQYITLILLILVIFSLVLFLILEIAFGILLFVFRILEFLFRTILLVVLFVASFVSSIVLAITVIKLRQQLDELMQENTAAEYRLEKVCERNDDLPGLIDQSDLSQY